MFSKKKLILLSILLAALPLLVHAEDLSVTCQQLLDVNNSCQNVSSAECQAQLQQCAAFYDQQSASIAQDITKTTAQKNTLQGQITALKKKITGLEYQINQGTLMVKDLNLQIGDTQLSITKTSVKIENSQGQITAILRAIYQEDQKPPVSILLDGNLADYFGNITYLEALNSKVSDLLESTKNLAAYLASQKTKMDSEKGVLQKTIKTQTLQRQQQVQNQQQQSANLRLTEAQYQQQLQDKAAADKKSAAIRSRIFDLLGVSNAPTFGQAYDIAKYVAGLTGVRAALLMAVLTQESNLGKNVGQCYVKNTQTGDGVKIKTGEFSPKTMNPARDIPVFLTLINDINRGKGLARDAASTPVSCVVYYNGKPYGWGGAMGPAQFIPSTWVNGGYGQKVADITGKVGDPWDIRDAFLANGLFLQALGAASGAAKAEFNAAMKYYCGGSCTSYDRFYGNSVVNIANQYEADIKAIGG